MRQLVVLFVSCFHLVGFSQNNQDLRDINLTTLKLIDDYARYSSVSSKKDKNNLFGLFSTDAIVYNDLVISENFNTPQTYKAYLKEMFKTSNKRIFYDADIQVRYLSPIQGDEKSGYLDVILEKNIQAQLDAYQISLNDTLQEYIDYNQTFLLRFSINYQLDSINNTYKTIIQSIRSERNEKKPNIYVFYEKNMGQNPVLIAEHKIHLLNTESGEKLVIKGNDIHYYLTNEVLTTFTYDNPSFRKNGKLDKEEGLDFKKIIFNEKITSSIDYNYSIVSNSNILGFNNYYTTNSLSDPQLILSDAENIIDVLSSSENMGFSFSLFPFKLKNKKNNISLSLGFKCNLMFSTINFNSDLVDFWYMDLDLDNLSYARHINLSLFNEVVNVNSQSLLLSFKLAYHDKNTVNNDKPIRISPFVGFNLSMLYLAVATYESSGEGHISGKYPQYFDIEVTDLLNDYGPFSFNSSSDLSVQSMLFNMDVSEFILGVDFTYKNIGLGIMFNQQIGSLLLFDEIKNDMLLTSENDVNSVTDVMSGVELKNNHLSFSFNFKF